MYVSCSLYMFKIKQTQNVVLKHNLREMLKHVNKERNNCLFFLLLLHFISSD